VEAKGIDDVRRDANKVCISMSKYAYFNHAISGSHRNSLMMAASGHRELTLPAALSLKRQGGFAILYPLVCDLVPFLLYIR
jgi:hypothetical protein